MKDSYDLIVVGSGPSGIASALYAAANGIQVLLIEKEGFLGGMSTSGAGGVWCGTASSGIFKEIREKLSEPVPLYGHMIYDSEELKEYYREKVVQTGLDVLLYAFVSSIEMDGNRIKSVSVCTKDGMRSFSADIFIDATGDGDISAMAGAGYHLGREDDGKMQPATLFLVLGGVDMDRENICLWKNNQEIKAKMRHAVQKGEVPLFAEKINIMPGKNHGTVLLNMTHCTMINGTKPEDLTKAEFECRGQIPSIVRFLRQNAPGYESCYVLKTGEMIGIRETRHLHGRYCLTHEDLIDGRVFDDWVVSGAWYPFDIHNMSGSGQDSSEPPEAVKPYTIPYRSFLPESVSNLLFTGRCISGTHLAHSSFRMMPPCFAMGQATGTAAAICIKHHWLPDCIEVGLLQRTLMLQGVDAPEASARQALKL